MGDYKLNIADETFSFDKENTVINNIYLSLKVQKGTFFQNPGFGMAAPPTKRTATAKNVIKQNVEDALQWMLDIGKLTNIDVFTEDSSGDRHRINALITATQADGVVVTFETFVELV